MTKKKKNRKKKQAKISKDFVNIERIWAENGLVRVLEQSGRGTTMTWRQAAYRIQALNKMKVPSDNATQTQKLIEKAIEVIREAKYQQELADNKKTQMIQNVLEGKTAEGVPLSEIETSEDKEVKKYAAQFTHLQEDEIRIVLNNDMSSKSRESMMQEVNGIRGEELKQRA